MASYIFEIYSEDDTLDGSHEDEDSELITTTEIDRSIEFISTSTEPVITTTTAPVLETTLTEGSGSTAYGSFEFIAFNKK